MALTKYKLGELIEESFRKNTDLILGIDSVRGISNAKQITRTKADVTEGVLHKFYIVNPGEFVYNPRTTRMGDKVGLGYNNTNQPLLFSFNNIAFIIRPEVKKLLLPEYLYMYYNRSEFDRYAITNSWGSATELFTFEEMRDIDIELPSLPIQQKYVDVYKAMLANQKSYERGLEDLKLTCDAYIENLRREMPCEKIGQYIQCTDRITDDVRLRIMGISNQQKFITSDSRTQGVNKEKYLRIDTEEFGYSPIHINDGSIAFNDACDSYLLSPIYKTFRVNDTGKLYPKYLMMWFARQEFARYCWYYAYGSARDNLEWKQMCEFEIPIPDIDVQKSIVNIYNCYLERTSINEKLKTQLKDICPILIKGALEEARQEETHG